MKKYIKGPYAVLLTPFKKNKVDLDSFAEQVRMLNRSDISGYISNGSTGEFTHLSLKEQMELSEIVAREKSEDKKLIVSACTSNLSDTAALCRHAGKIGAHAVLVCPPYYFKYPANERLEYFKAVADLSPVPVVLYNIPFFTQELELDVIYKLFEHKNVCGIKDSSANMKRLIHMAEKTKDSEISIMTGTDDILISALIGGCSGSFTAGAAIIPDDICAIYKAVSEGDMKKALEIQYSILPSLRKADSMTFPKGYKLFMEEKTGIAFGDKEVAE